ncbi:MAG: hypothetical protein GX416_07130 [Bacteroidales bacterium]|nr:hypothetical protein [Bacteroidales bacterium]
MKYKYIFLLSALMLLGSCSDWLDVNPVTEVRESKLYSSEEGYKEALNGVYILLGQKELYGKTVTMYIPEMIAHTWAVPTESKDPTGYYLTKFDYSNSNVEAAIDDMWSKYYTAIAQVNDILFNIQKSKVNFTNGNKDLISGECYGLRAFLHLDILRLFGPIPDNAVGSSKCIPYVTDFTTDVAKLQSATYDDVIKGIESDLNKSENLLATADPAVKAVSYLDAPSSSSSMGISDFWQYYRQLRFNYFAALATKARFYYWIGQKDKAVEYAKKVVLATDKSNNRAFTLCDEAYYTAHPNANFNMKMEHIFGLYNSSFDSDVYTPYYAKANHIFTQDPQYLDVCYESSLYPDDIRYKDNRCWAEISDVGSVSTSIHFFKYDYNGSYYGMATVPCIRLSEMYFILIEDESVADMMSYFKIWRLARGLDSSIDNTMTTTSAVLSRMEKEWRKEFMGEGQMFFFYKKHSYTSFSWPTSVSIPLNSYVIPIPKSQTSFE